MGRIFEKRKHKMFARYDRMAKMFTRIGKEIAIAVKASGPDPDNNPRLRTAIQNAKGINMPKDRIEAAIKRASSKEDKNYEEVVYEGYGPHGVAILIETATDNPTRTVASIRLYLNRAGGSLGTSGSLNFIFNRKGFFKLQKGNLNTDELELELIDNGLEDLQFNDEEIHLYTDFTDFGAMSKALEERGLVPTSSELIRIPTTTVNLNETQEEELMELIEKIEADDDVQQVFHNIAGF
ncbi:MAG TPA: YebC/PmpR family DNA-binding transcriptional regulator [Luteibaculaceae bacterium]|nr:YebC/PmpR family DNA-binding transcriptional regulator [Luteibaculaceae bacterium]